MPRNNGNGNGQQPQKNRYINEAERDIVANLLKYPEVSAKCGALRKEHFGSAKLGEAFAALQTAPADLGGRLAVLYDLGWMATDIANLEMQALAPSLCGHHASKIVDAASNRKLQGALSLQAEELQSAPYSPVTKHLESLRGVIDGLTASSTGNEATSLAKTVISLLREIGNGDDVIPTGFADLDESFRGWPKGTLSVVAARPGIGKSAFLLNAALRLAQRGVPTLFVGLEDRKEQHARRLLSVLSGVPLSLITFSGVTLHEGVASDLTRCAAGLSEIPLYFLDGPLTAGEVVSAARAHMDRLGVQAVIVDHIQEIMADEEDRRDQRTYEIQACVQKLRNLAAQSNSVVVAAAQINREAEKTKDMRPRLSHLRDSGSVEMIARLVLLLYRDEVYNEDTDKRGILEVNVGKANHGPSGITKELSWIGEQCKVADLTRRYP